MAFYTVLEKPDFEKILSQYNLGELESFRGIEGGIENSNYILVTSKQDKTHRYILTVFEELPVEDVPYHIDLLNELSDAGLPVPVPVSSKQGKFFYLWKGKPYIIVSYLPGKHIDTPTPAQCQVMAEALARFHLTAVNLPQNHAGIRGISWMEDCVNQTRKYLDDEDKSLSEKVLQEFLELEASENLPKGIIHGDLFRDNALFDGDKLTGMIDFYSAGEGYLLYDFAVLVNDWCSNSDGSLDPERLSAASRGYQALRPFCAEELSSLGLVNQIAAMRFWLSRLLHSQREDNQNPEKNPKEYRRIFMHRISEPLSI